MLDPQGLALSFPPCLIVEPSNPFVLFLSFSASNVLTLSVNVLAFTSNSILLRLISTGPLVLLQLLFLLIVGFQTKMAHLRFKIDI